ncbi:LysR family transcriptional regulator [uncultured Mailhella sp.]|uniref:LysR family transcriptional regulator n=1 Tax=uncultured Mailhella sp. TaxID=1981031 RepID=UPI0025F59E7E|nr:LysR family transcriptional regulator [uncultured Mailhella sp.]
MRIEYLAYFLEIAKRKSLNTAASRLGVSQQALSACIKKMEQELGVTLFLRNRQGCRLTQEGEKVRETAENMVASYRTLCADLKKKDKVRQRAPLSGMLKVYTNYSFFLPLNPNIIKGFCETYPQLRLSITELPQQLVYEKILSSSDDAQSIGLINVPYAPDGSLAKSFLPPPPLKFQPFVQGGYLACVGKISPLARSKRLSLKTLLKYPVVMGSSEEMTATPLHYLLKQYGSPRFILSASTLSLWSMVVTNNSGIGFIHDVLLKKDEPLPTYLQDLAFIRIKEKLAAVTGYVLPLHPGAAALELIKWLTPQGAGPNIPD